MGWIYTKRKNGKWNIWSTIADGFLLKDTTLREVEEWAIKTEQERIKITLTRTFHEIAKGNKAYFKTEKELKEFK